MPLKHPQTKVDGHISLLSAVISPNNPPGFDPRNYGYRKLGELLHSMQLFEMEERSVGEGQSKALYIRDKRK